MSSSLVEIKDLLVARGRRTILDIPILDIKSGEVLAIIGPNGSGKTTLLYSLMMLQPPDKGDIYFDGRIVEPGNCLAYRRRIAAVFQEPLLLDTTVFENVATGLKLRGFQPVERQKRVTEWLRRFGIESLAERRARTLSGGEAQRASLARAFVLEPEILFLDEPFVSLDRPTKSTLIADFEDIVNRTKTTVVLVTHELDEATALGDRIAVLIEGRIQQIDRPEIIFREPANKEVADFVGRDIY